MSFDPGKRYKFLCCCGAGLGSSQMLASKLRMVCSKRGIQAKVDVASAGEGVGAAPRYDATFCNKNFVKVLAKAEAKGTKIYGLDNVINADEINQNLDLFFGEG
ncbi:PTS sugar transporter subunit IIB [Colidextribacter sp. OB.20]|uniref:PTS sugar transporter subunit IIB n=1 Tax=Colidextribacter sp. OB.20 TaxID=2304568 RepID=UPI00136CFAB8|nr:PTS sugar transporter subunit IIB [Colidextribacter sp. OB.20]NBI11614.1 PTS sugar transporter subunit IIB [Colidextribacter sp. OB.20]